ncbi:MAG: sulfotransferase, partial [Phycisphaerales bacterium]
WPRMVFVLFTCFVGTVCTVLERVLLWFVRMRRFRHDPRIEHEPGVVVILGYYRSGTTHLHNLMACDPRFVTPRWHQCLAGQGFWIGWSVVRFLLVPFLGSTRPQDGVGFGPDWPAEDDFALATWGLCSPIPGRLVFPSGWEDWQRWHDLENLTDKEKLRWRSLTAMLVWKLTRGRNRHRRVLLKTPSHTSRVAEIERLCRGNVRFVHLVRPPRAVIDSNVRMHEALSSHLLEDAPDVQTLRDRIVEEYAATEDKCTRELEAIEQSRVTRIRYQDLRADGPGTLETVYTRLGLGWDERTNTEVRDYLSSLGAYSSDREPMDLGEVTDHERELCQEMTLRYGLDEPTVEARPVEPAEREPAKVRRGAMVAVATMAACWGLWLLFVWVYKSMITNNTRAVPLVWVFGAAIGLCARWASGRGTRGLGILCAALTVFMVVTVLFPVSVINWNWAAEHGTRAWLYHNWKNAYYGLQGSSSIVMIVLGSITAYKHASADGPRPPGM